MKLSFIKYPQKTDTAYHKTDTAYIKLTRPTNSVKTQTL